MSRSLKLIITFRKCICDIVYIKEYAQSFFYEFSEFLQDETYRYDIFIKEPRSIDIDNVYTAEIFEIEVILEYAAPVTYRSLCAKIIQDWCNPGVNKLSNLWLRIADPSVIENNGKLHHSDVQIKEIAFGTFPDMQHFMQHYHYMSNSDEKELMTTFLHCQRKLTIFTCFTHSSICYHKTPIHNKFEFNYQSISQVIVNYVSDSDLVQVYFHLYHIPLMYAQKENRIKAENNSVLASDQDYQAKSWERTLDFGCKCRKFKCAVERIGRCTVFKIVIPKKHKTYDIVERLMQRCSTNTFFHFTSIKTVYSKLPKPLKDFDNFPFDENIFRLIPDKYFKDDIKFKCQFAWEVVLCKSAEVKDQILLKYEKDSTSDHWENLKKKLKSFFTHSLDKYICDIRGYINKRTDALTKSLYDVSEMINKNLIFVFEEAVERLFDHHLEMNESEIDDVVPDGMCLVRRVILTPSNIVCLPPSEHFDNRVIRKFGAKNGAENFLRISVQDDNLQKLTFAVQYHSKKREILMRVAGRLLLDGIIIGPRKYEILASSNSQLREHGLWMYAKDQSGNTAESIRKWMGDFSDINNVAKYMARMGQCFSTSDEAVQIELNEDEVVNLPDVTLEIKDRKYIFSDGVGMISKDLAEEVRQAYVSSKNLDQLDSKYLYDPSAFQIRFQGCKGMLAESRTLSGRKIGIRPSMKKFPCNSTKVLEIVKISAPRPVYLNRPLITILENLGVEGSVFLDLQKKMVFDLTDSLIYEKKASRMLENCTSLEYPFKKLRRAGISLTQEPFFRSLLLCVYKSLIANLKRKARIAIPPKYGRNMLGIMDETETLKYGQIFAQYSEEVGNILSPTKILKGTVVVTKNPCMHPGDVRKFKAVDVPELHHIKDCIVFPAKGKRPHPDEMAGSDLDGDEYVLLWEPNLIFPEKNHEAMDFPPNEEITLDRPIEVADMIDFLCTYIQNDNIGTMANAYLAWADYNEDGIFSDVCMKIAQKYPQALDFAKSGTTKYLESSERPKHYPDFMEKGCRNNNYKSSKTLGLLYRVIRNLEASVSNINSEPVVIPDSRFEYPGWETFENLAKQRKDQYSKRVKNILRKFGIKSESEAFTGYINELNEYNQNKYDSENAPLLSKKYMYDTIKRYKVKFLQDCQQQRVNYSIPKEEVKYMMASAWYMVTYQDEETSILSFPWAVSDLLLEIKVKQSKEKRATSENPFINSFDKILLNKFKNLNVNGTCYCRLVLHDTMFNWVKNSAFILTVSSTDVFCTDCFGRIIENFRKYNKMLCCSSAGDQCICSQSCSPMKLVLECFKYYASEVIPEIGMCPEGTCEGFRDLNLQSLALKTYAVIAITRSLQNVSPIENNVNAVSDSNEEGDPIRVRVTEELKEILTGRVDDVSNILKDLSGVKQVHIDGSPERNGYYILVQSIGKAFNRWNLEELIMDPKCPSIIQSRLS